MRFGTGFICLFIVGLCAYGARGADESKAKELEFFEKRIRPLFAERCQKCHGPDRVESDLRVDSYEGITEGGVSGDFVVPGKPDESLLLIAISYQNEDLQMPPDAKLSAEEIEDVRRWVRQGAIHPEAPKTAPPKPAELRTKPEGSDFWAFQAPVASPVPVVRDTRWVRNPIDHFVLAKLEAAGIAPQPPAEPRRLARRVAFDLVGLPPTPDEIKRFLSDEAPDAYDRLVDRLLNSPHYGERWGRHWLDVARYADSNGLDENVAHGNAWRYRDYVIDALNRDKPFNRFISEQIAGDLLPASDEATRHEQLVATGFLSLGPKVLAEVDERKMELDIVDEQIDTVGRAFLSLTVGCARCHDHKFDPISTEDYYALAGIFRSTKTMETFTKVAKWHENTLAQQSDAETKRAFEQKIANQKAEIQRVVDEAHKALLNSLPDALTVPADAESRYADATKTALKKLRAELSQIEKAGPAFSTAMGVIEGTVKDTEVCIRGSHLSLGRAVPRGVPAIFAASAPQFSSAQSGRLELASWLTDRRNPLTARVIVNRAWRWHFGRGLVESTDNFGQLGERPSNQPLLDWLAVWFMDHQWSIKELQRLIVDSATFQQDSTVAALNGANEAPSYVDTSHVSGAALAAGSSLENRTEEPEASAIPLKASDIGRSPSTQSPQTIDPDNHLLWHFPVRRLEAEAIRDALLAVSGQLDTARGGSLVHVGNREYLFDHTSKDETKYDSRKRSVYLPVIRNHLYDVFDLFDSTDATVPSGDRASSTVATQALFMLNSPLMLDASRELAVTVLADGDDDRTRTTLFYERCFGRSATASEQVRAARFLTNFKAVHPLHDQASPSVTLDAWTALGHVLLASNEFVYVQ